MYIIFIFSVKTTKTYDHILKLCQKLRKKNEVNKK